MIFHIDDHTEVDTERDLCSEEKHVLQKVLCYKLLATSMKEFREKTDKALQVGWNNSGPVTASQALTLVIQHIEKDVWQRLTNENSSTQ